MFKNHFKNIILFYPAYSSQYYLNFSYLFKDSFWCIGYTFF